MIFCSCGASIDRSMAKQCALSRHGVLFLSALSHSDSLSIIIKIPFSLSYTSLTFMDASRLLTNILPLDTSYSTALNLDGLNLPRMDTNMGSVFSLFHDC